MEEIGPSSLGAADKDAVYYTLLPVFTSRSRIMTPVDNDKIVMRPVISKTEASKIMRSIASIECLTVEDEKFRENTYKEVVKSCDCRNIIGMLKAIEVRRQERIAIGKKVTANDEKYFNLAIDKLSGEFAIALNKDKDEVKVMVTEKVRK